MQRLMLSKLDSNRQPTRPKERKLAQSALSSDHENPLSLIGDWGKRREAPMCSAFGTSKRQLILIATAQYLGGGGLCTKFYFRGNKSNRSNITSAHASRALSLKTCVAACSTRRFVRWPFPVTPRGSRRPRTSSRN